MNPTIEIKSQTLESLLEELNRLVKERLKLKDTDCIVWVYESDKKHSPGEFIGTVRLNSPEIVVKLEFPETIRISTNGTAFLGAEMIDNNSLADKIVESFPEHLK